MAVVGMQCFYGPVADKKFVHEIFNSSRIRLSEDKKLLDSNSAVEEVFGDSLGLLCIDDMVDFITAAPSDASFSPSLVLDRLAPFDVVVRVSDYCALEENHGQNLTGFIADIEEKIIKLINSAAAMKKQEKKKKMIIKEKVDEQ
jgi:hypothetical protein